jgi:DNA helicase HerA-like ATPase
MRPLPIGIYTHAANSQDNYSIPPKARQRHMAIFGKSGVGKTTLMRNMILWDIVNGLGVTVEDPHGQLIDELLDHIPRSRTNDVIYFNPHDTKAVPGINILERVQPDYRPLVVSALISTLKNIWPDGWGPQTEYLLSNFTFALLEQDEPVTLLALPKLLTDSAYRAHVLSRVSDPAVRGFFHIYDEVWDKDQRAHASAPLLNKASKFITNPLLRNIIGQPSSTFDFRRMMDKQQILLCDLSKGALGEDVSSLLGSLITTKMYLAALSRQDTQESERVPHFFYIDEVHNFTYGIDLASILSEARKYRLTLTIATQTLNQLQEKTVAAVFGNCATVICFRVSGADAKVLEYEFAMTISAAQLEELPDFKLYIKTLIEAEHSDQKIMTPAQPKLLTTYPPFVNTTTATTRKKLIRASQERFARQRTDVEVYIHKQLLRE